MVGVSPPQQGQTCPDACHRIRQVRLVQTLVTGTTTNQIFIIIVIKYDPRLFWRQLACVDTFGATIKVQSRLIQPAPSHRYEILCIGRIQSELFLVQPSVDCFESNEWMRG